MESHHYTCNYCQKEFIPKRRKVQKFCSSSCRVRNHQLSQKFNKPAKLNAEKTKIDQVSVAGVTNAAIGTSAVDLFKHIFIPEQNKSATKADLRRLESKLKRYHHIKNMNQNHLGQLAYFDMELGILIYRFES
jgi:hypothetical protein